MQGGEKFTLLCKVINPKNSMFGYVIYEKARSMLGNEDQ
jgi:hypothetical protein